MLLYMINLAFQYMLTESYILKFLYFLYLHELYLLFTIII